MGFFNYPLFHSFAEIFSVVVAASVFIIAWNARRLMSNNYLLLIGISFLFVAILDTVHTFAYKGVGVFPVERYGGSNLSTQLWLAARFVQAISFLAAPFFIGRKLKTRPIFLALTFTTAMLLASIFWWKVFPISFVDGQGMTKFKVVSELTISAIMAVAIYALYRKREFFDGRVYRFLIAAMSISVVSELMFSTYRDVYDLKNFVGHILKIISYYFIYRAIVVTGLATPYDILFQNLRQSEKNLRAERDLAQKYLDLAKVMFLFISTDRAVNLVNKKACEILGYEQHEIVGKDWFAHFLPREAGVSQRVLFDELVSGRLRDFDYYESKIARKDGRERTILWRNTVMRDEDGNITGILSAGEDISDYKALEEKKDSIRKIVAEGEVDLVA